MTLLVEATTSRSLLLEQHIRYEYSAPVERLRQRLIVVPPGPRRAAPRWVRSPSTAWTRPFAAHARTDSATSSSTSGSDASNAGFSSASTWQSNESLRTISTGSRSTLASSAPTPLTRADARIRDLVIPGAEPADICARASARLPTSRGHRRPDERRRGDPWRPRCLPGLRPHHDRRVPAAGIAARYVSGHLVGEGAAMPGSRRWSRTRTAPVSGPWRHGTRPTIGRRATGT